MSRWLVLGAFAVAVASAQQAPSPPPPPASDQTQLPPEEDKTEVPKQYAFNPLQSKKEVTVGDFYFKKGDYRAAAGRFREATRWNDGNAEAWLRLGEAEEKNHDPDAARKAYEKYLQVSPQAKNAAEVKKKIERLKS